MYILVEPGVVSGGCQGEGRLELTKKNDFCTM